MKDILLQKLVIVVESTNCKNISSDIMDSIYALEKSVACDKEHRLSFALHENAEKTKNIEYISPEHWDYWPV